MVDEKNPTIEKILEVLEGLRPYLYMEGGDVEFVKYDEKDHIVFVRLTGACKDCMYSDDTLQNGLFETLKAEIPEIEGVINVDI